jgi:uracil-DNA glycosylase
MLGAVIRSDTDRRAHFKQIARCPVMAECLSSQNSSSPCASVVLSQWQHLPNLDPADLKLHWKDWHQLPEPWVGHLDQARILFVSSNPSISNEVPRNFRTASPPAGRITARWKNDQIIRRFKRAFDDHMDDGVRFRGKKGVVRYWASVKQRAIELLPNSDLEPGVDYALTEVVRCKTPSEWGVASAVQECAPRYLQTTLELSPAVVFVSLGAHARRALVRMFDVDAARIVGRALTGWEEAGVTSINVAGTERLVAFLPHPNARKPPKTFAKNLRPRQLRRLQDRLNEHLR